MKIKGQKKDNKKEFKIQIRYINRKGWIAIGITLLLAILLNLYNKGYFSF